MRLSFKAVLAALTLLACLAQASLPRDSAAAEDAKWRADMAAAEKALERLNYSRARRHLEKALKRADARKLGNDALMETLTKLGDVHRVLVHPEEAWKHLERALRIGEEAYGSKHPLSARAHFYAAQLFEDFRRWKRAETHYRRAHEIAKQTLDKDDLLTSDIEDRLGRTELRLDRPKVSTRHFALSLARRKRAPEPDQEAIAETLTGLGLSYYRRYRLEDSERVLMRALGLAREHPGPGTPIHLEINMALLDVRLSREIRDGIENKPGALADEFRGVKIIVAPPTAGFTKADAAPGLSEIKTALGKVYEKSPFLAQKLDALTRSSRPIVIFDSRFPFGQTGIIGSFYPYIFDDRDAPPGQRKLPVVVGRNIVPHDSSVDPRAARWNRDDLALTLAHELIGHGLQELRRDGRLAYEDAECEALLYEYQAHRDVKKDMGSELSVNKRSQIDGFWCADFKYFMKETRPQEMAIWEQRILDSRRLIEHFESYAEAVMRPQ